MQPELKSKPLTVVLLLVSLAIWGIIGARVYESFDGPDKRELPESAKKQDAKTGGMLPLSANEFNNRRTRLRDPFMPRAKRSLSGGATNRLAADRKNVPLDINYVGFVDGIDGKLAIVVARDRGSRLCLVGDTAFSVRVIKIEPDRLIVMQKERRRSLTLRQSQEE